MIFYLSFRPLTGFMVLNSREVCGYRQGRKVSVPLRGLWFLTRLKSAN